MHPSFRTLQRLVLASIGILLILGLGLHNRQPEAQAQSIPALHLALGNPSNAATDVNLPTNYLMEKPQYALAYNRDLGHANWVSWHLGFQDLGTTARTDNWQPDSALPTGWYRVMHSDYTGSGYDRGHMTPSADRTASVADNSATFLMTNIIPQAPDNNQGPWVDLEDEARTQVGAGNELYIISGGAGSLGMIPSGRVEIPARTWKILVVLPEGENDLTRISTSTRVIAVDMPNTQGIRTIPWQTYRTSVDALEALTGYDFLSNVDPAIQSVIEAGIDGGPTPTPTPTHTPTIVLCPTAVSANSAPQCTPTPSFTPTHTPTPGTPANSSYLPMVKKPFLDNSPTPTLTFSPTPTVGPCPRLLTGALTPQCTATPVPFTPTPVPFTPTSTPGTLPPSYNNCQPDPNAAQAPNYPALIVAIDKVAETVTVRNATAQTLDISGWRICSMTGSQLHATLSGSLAVGETRLIPSQAGAPIWSNSNPDPGAFYNAQGSLVSYWNN